MKFSINREQLLKPLQQVAAVVEKRQTLPVLSNVLLEVGDGQLSMTGTDLELELVARLPLEGEHQAGETTVPARKLVDIAKSLPAEADIRFEVDGERMLVRSGRSRFTLSTLPASEFPNLEEDAAGSTLDIQPGVLRGLIDRTAFSMAQQDVRYYLNGMLFELKPGRLRAVRALPRCRRIVRLGGYFAPKSGAARRSSTNACRGRVGSYSGSRATTVSRRRWQAPIRRTRRLARKTSPELKILLRLTMSLKAVKR